MKIFITLIFCTLTFLNDLIANPDSLALVDKDKAIQFLKDGQRDSSNLYKDKAIQYFKTNGDVANRIHLHQRLGRAHGDVYHDYDKAFQEFFTIIDEEKTWKRPLKEEAYKRLAWLYFFVGHNFKNQNNQRSALNHFEIGASIYSDTLGKKDYNLANYFYSQIGNASNRLRDYDNAELYIKKSIEILLQEEEWDDAASAFSDLGMVYLNQEKYPKAIETFLRGLSMSEMYIETEILLTTNLADAYFKNGETKNGLTYLDKCILLIGKSDLDKLDKEESLIWPFIFFGNYYKSEGDFYEAENFYDKALSNSILTDQNNLRTLSEIHIYKGLLSFQKKEMSKALASYNNVLVLLLPTFTDTNPNSLPTEDQLVDEPNLIDALGGMARTYVQIYNESQSSAIAQKVLKCYDLATKVESMLLQSYFLEGSKMTALREHHWLKEEVISFAYELWNKEGTDDLVEKMFSVSEKSRAILLMENADFASAINSAQMIELRKQFIKKNDKLGELKDAMYNVSRAKEKNWEAAFNELKVTLFDIKEEIALMMRKVAALNPQVKLIGDQSFATTREVQKGLQKDQALIEYFIGGNSLYTFIITKDTIDVKKTVWNSNWSEKAKTISDNIFEEKNDAYIRQALELYSHIVDPFLEITSVQNFLIIPDGELWNIPFDALLTKNINPEDEESGNFMEFPYLLLNKNISHPFSATLFLQKQKIKNKKSQNNFFAFAPSYIERQEEVNPLVAMRNSLTPLEYNQPEAEEIFQILNKRGSIFLDSEATKNIFQQNLNDASIIHIAAHAKANLLEPNLSYIAFSNTSDTSNKTKLYAYELYNNTISAEMVVLSGCETGTGPIAKGEGVISLSRAFAFGGARSIITTLWSIDDSATKEIMIKFYKNLKKGLPKDQSLQKAKRDYIEGSERIRAHPKYWAAFTPLGNMNAIEFESFSWTPYWLGFLGVMLITFFLWFRKKS